MGEVIQFPLPKIESKMPLAAAIALVRAMNNFNLEKARQTIAWLSKESVPAHELHTRAFKLLESAYDGAKAHQGMGFRQDKHLDALCVLTGPEPVFYLGLVIQSAQSGGSHGQKEHR